LTHCDIHTIGHYQEDSNYSYKGSDRKTLFNNLLWNVYLNCKFYQVLIDGEMLESDNLCNKVSDTFLEQSLTLKEIFDMELLKVKIYAKSIVDEDMSKELNKYMDDMNILRDEF